MESPPLEVTLVGIVGAAHVLTDRQVVAGYEVDWTGQFVGRALVVVRPAHRDEVAACVRACGEWSVPIVTQGGNTGLVGGSVPDTTGSAVVLSTTRLTAIGAVDRTAAQVTAGAGVTLAQLQAHVAKAGFAFGVDLAARDSATIGGMVATNAGGIHVLRHGTMRHQVVGIEAVLGNADVVTHLGGLEKDNTGYDLAGLLCGSEGTLGIVTAVRVRLVPLPIHRVTALLAWRGLRPMIDGLSELRRAVPEVEAAEYIMRAGLELVLERHDLSDPFPVPHPAYLLVETAAQRDPSDAVASAVGGLDAVLDVAVATEAAARARLWALRELHTETLAASRPRKYDVTLPPGAIPAFLDEVARIIRERGGPHAFCHHFGHLGDGNVHLNVVGIADRLPTDLDGIDDAVLSLVAAHEGSISAEHGIGRLKRKWLPLARSEAEIRTFRAIKGALDPDGILNPGVLLD